MPTTLQQEAATAPGETALLERLRAGDRGAFDELVAAHRRAVYLMARRLLGNHEDADEAAQLAFVRAWQALDRFRGDSSLRTWLTRIVLNVAKTMRARRRPSASLDEGAPGDEAADRSPAPDERLRRDQLRRRVRRAVAGLPDKQREVVVLKVFSGLTHRQVADAMGLAPGTIKAHLHQAVSNLRRRMAAQENEGNG